MALSQASFFNGFNTYNTFTGQAMPGLLMAISKGTYTWITTPGGVVCTSITAGSAGTGNIVGAVTCPPPVLPGLISLASAKGLAGPAAPALITTIALGFQQAMLTANYKGTSPTVSTGSDALIIVSAIEPTLSADILSSMTGVGQATPMFCAAISSVICTILLTCTGVGVISPVGPVVASPSTGSGQNLTFF